MTIDLTDDCSRLGIEGLHIAFLGGCIASIFHFVDDLCEPLYRRLLKSSTTEYLRDSGTTELRYRQT